MAIIYDKTFRPVYLNMDATILGELDEYRSSSMPRSKHIHDALVLYLEHLKQTGRRKSIWTITKRDKK
jgi:metal-responsive CopG/Arc/MetJ family transcriptional regulator